MIIQGSNTQDVIFHDAATDAAQGLPFEVFRFRTLVVEVYGTSTTRTVSFKASGPSGMLYTLAGVKLSDLTTGSTTSGTGELWQFDVTGLNKVYMDLTAVTGGNVTVKGKAVA